jgi:hypothetical protein
MTIAPGSRRVALGTSACVDGNEAAARVAYAFSEVIPIYPITPSSPMAELADEWAAASHPNLWGAVPEIVEMQLDVRKATVVGGPLAAGWASLTVTWHSEGLVHHGWWRRIDGALLAVVTDPPSGPPEVPVVTAR